MNFGMFTDFHIRQGMTQAEAFEESFQQVEAAEELGLDAVWLAEHHFSPDRSVLASPLIIASAIAARTRRIRMGIAVQVLPLTNPLRVAEEAATVDHISQGRFNLGIGRSGLTKYYQGYNVPYEESRERFSEALEVLRKAWAQETFSHQGTFHSYTDVTVVPRPLQQPHPPVHIALASPETFTRVGQMGYPIFISANTAIPQLQERLQLYHEARREAGHTGPPNIALRIPAYVADTAQRAHDEPEASTMHAIEYGVRQLSASAGSAETAARLRNAANTSYDDLLKQRLMYGTPEAIVERLNMYRESLGITGVVMEMNYGGQNAYDRVLHSVRLMATKVMPQFK